MKILIIRHGDPDYEKDSLTEKGFKEAKLLSVKLSKMDIKEFYVSPLGRAKDTANITLKNMKRTAKEMNFLREFNSPVIDINTSEKVIPWDLMPSYWTTVDDYFDNEKWMHTPLMTSGNVKDEYLRVTSEFDKVLSENGYERKEKYYNAVKANTDTIVFFCHFGVECVLLSHLLSISPIALWHGFIALPTSVTTLISEEQEKGSAYFRCQSFGDLSHLYSGDEEPAFAGRFCEIFEDETKRH
ncbi:MAG: histidine phosphatase family protein [Oscillospiraceae bacterium]